MHILAFAQKPDNRLGGQERSLFEVCQGLQARGVDVSLMYQESGNLLDEYQSFCRQVISFPGSYEFDPYETHTFLRSLGTLMHAQWLEEWDVFYVNHYKNITLPAVLGLLVRRPVVCHLRLPPPHYLSRQYRWGLNRCAAVVAISQFIKQEYRDEGIESPDIPVVYNGVNLDTFHVNPNQSRENASQRHILYLGRITPLKGLDTLLDAFDIMVQHREDVSMLIAGDEHGGHVPTGYKKGLRERAEAIDSTVRFIPHQEDVRPLLSRADLVVVPSEWGEPFGRVVIEAMAARVPVVATDDGGIPEILMPEFEDHVVPAADPEALAQALLRHIDWRDENPSLGHEMRGHVKKHFSVGRTLKSLETVFQDVLRNETGRERKENSRAN